VVALGVQDAADIVSTVTGEFRSGRVSGWAEVKFVDGARNRGNTSEGAFHGVVRHFDRPFSKARKGTGV
jgi:hypothetical protein